MASESQREEIEDPLLVAPASLRDRQSAEREGTLQVLLDAGAELLANSCGMCAGYGDTCWPENAVAISTTRETFKGRMGAGVGAGLPGLAVYGGGVGGRRPRVRSAQMLP